MPVNSCTVEPMGMCWANVVVCCREVSNVWSCHPFFVILYNGMKYLSGVQRCPITQGQSQWGAGEWSTPLQETISLEILPSGQIFCDLND